MIALYWYIFCFKIACTLNNNRLALKYALAIQKRSPGDIRVLKGMTLLLKRSEIYDGAMRTAELYLKESPDDPHILFTLAELYMVEGSPLDSLSTFLRLDRLVDTRKATIPDREKLLNNIRLAAYVIEREGLSATELSNLESLKGLSELKKWKLHEYYANMLYHWGRLDDSLAEFQQALSHMKDSALIFYGIGRIMAERRQYEKAIDYLEQAINSTIGMEFVPFARVDLAFCYFCSGNKKAMSSQLLIWKNVEHMMGSYQTRMKAACLWRTNRRSRRKGELLCKNLIKEFPSPSLVLCLRNIENEIGIEQISLAKLGVSKYFNDNNVEGRKK